MEDIQNFLYKKTHFIILIYSTYFNVGKIRSAMQQLGQKFTPDKTQQFGTKVRDKAFQIGRKVSNTLGKV